MNLILLEDICKDINNFFTNITYSNISFIINNNKIKTEIELKLLTNQYIKIENTIFNDGIYKIKLKNDTEIEIDDLIDENIKNGIIKGLIIPKNFLNLVKNIEIFKQKNDKKQGIQSESIPNYSVNYSTTNWSENFKSQLDIYRKFPE